MSSLSLPARSMNLLIAARTHGTEADYIMIKLLAGIDISLSDLAALTMEKLRRCR